MKQTSENSPSVFCSILRRVARPAIELSLKSLLEWFQQESDEVNVVWLFLLRVVLRGKRLSKTYVGILDTVQFHNLNFLLFLKEKFFLYS